MPIETSNPPTIAPPAGAYSHVAEVPANARWVFVAGQVATRPDGTVPEGFAAQHEQVWRNTLAALAAAGMGPEDIVRLTVYSTDPEGIKVMGEQRIGFVGDHRPVSTWLVVAGLASPDFIVEMDTYAAKVD